ncbi:pentatricopeptide repeat-containing protein At1g73710 [Rutidosis leptorrhynchoides]|uniref:pentatricopeptide repeat-containing protein At1g73710 n=1 Tax=Rutidosis leptorrhynchoides TaxID=125765 RepID=UPI003A99C9CD
MLKIYSHRDISRESMNNPQAVYSPCKLQTLHPSSFNLISVQGFYVNPDKIHTRVYLGFNFKLQANSQKKYLVPTRISTIRNSVSNYTYNYNSNNTSNKKKFGGILPSILKSLDSEDDVDKTLDLYYGKLNPKEQTVILKEQRNWEKVVRVFDWMKSQPDYLPNVIHYNVVLRVLGRSRKWDELRRCWIDMAKNGILPTNNTYGMLVDVYGKAGFVKEALLWIKHMKIRAIFPDEVTMNTVVRVLKDGGEYDRADWFYKDWCVGKVDLDDLDLDSMADSDSGSDPVSLTRFLLTELFRTGGRDHTKSMVQFEVENGTQKPRLTATYNTLIDLYAKAGRLKEAGDVFNEMLKSGIAMDTITFNTMIFTCGSNGNLSEAETLLSEMEERGIRPDTKTYNIFLSLYADAGNIDEALRCYKMIREVGLFPDVVTYRAVLQILSERKMVREVENVIREIDESGLYIDRQSVPLVVKMYLDKGLTELANLLFEKCRKNGQLSSKTYAAVIDAYAQKGLWAEAEYVFGCEREKDIVEYNVMIKAYGIAKFYNKAFSLFKGMKSQGIWPDECTYNSLIQMFSGGDLVDDARHLLGEMIEVGFKPSCLTFSSVIASYARLRMLTEADEIYQEMMKSGVKPNEVVYGSLINGFAESSELDEALRYFGIMQESGLPANQVVLTTLIKAYSKSGVIDGARMIYQKMKQLPNGPDVVASNSMLSLYADLGMVSEAKTIFDYLRKNRQADSVSFATMMYVYKNMGMLDEAIEVAKEMKNCGLLIDCSSFNKVMACYATSGQLVKCGEMLHDMIVTQKVVPTNGTFKVLFTVLRKGGIQTEGVEQLEIAYRDGKPYASQSVITVVFSVLGMHTYALEFFEKVVKFETGLDRFVYNVAIYVYGSLGRIDDAFKMFLRMQDEGLEADVVTYIYLVGCYAKAGMSEGVKRVYSKLKSGELDPNESLFKAVIDGYKVMNRHDLAELVNQEMNLVFNTESLTESENEDEVEETSESLFV